MLKHELYCCLIAHTISVYSLGENNLLLYDTVKLLFCVYTDKVILLYVLLQNSYWIRKLGGRSGAFACEHLVLTDIVVVASLLLYTAVNEISAYLHRSEPGHSLPITKSDEKPHQIDRLNFQC